MINIFRVRLRNEITKILPKFIYIIYQFTATKAIKYGHQNVLMSEGALELGVMKGSDDAQRPGKCRA